MTTDLDRRATSMRGWISFGAMVRLVSGAFNIIGGLVAVSVAQGYAGNVVVISRDLTAWGWTWLICGLLGVLVGAGIFTGGPGLGSWGRAEAKSLSRALACGDAPVDHAVRRSSAVRVGW